jgi:hypothetical protein
MAIPPFRGVHGFDEFHGFRGTGRGLRAHGDPGE